MANVYFSITVAEDGGLNIPAFAVRGLGFSPGDEVALTLPLETPGCGYECGCDELLLARICDDAICGGYTTGGNAVNIPARMFAKAGIPVNTEVSVMAGDGALVLVAGMGGAKDLPDEIAELLLELDIHAGPPIPLGMDF